MPVYEDDLDDDEDDFADLDDEDDDDATVACPYCHDPVYEDAERCPGCGHYLSREDAPRGLPAWWIVLGVVAGLVGVLMWVVR